MNSTQSAAQMFAVQNQRGEEIRLVMQELTLAGHILPVGARIVVRHLFRSADIRPVEAVYAFGLPRDAALRQFRIEGKQFSVTSDLQEVQKAFELYESGIQQGRLSALARQYGDGLINLSIGNLRPAEEVSVFLEVIAGVEARDDGYRFRFPFCLAPSYHSDIRAAEAEPGVGEMELPEERFGDLLLPRFKKTSEGLHQIGFELMLQQPDPRGQVSSPSHHIGVRSEGQGEVRVTMAREKDVPNRDLVVDVRYTSGKPLVFTGMDERGQGQLAVSIPSTCFGTPDQEPARLALVLDRSGSMSGTPITQARKAVEACLAALSPQDMFGIVLFDHTSMQFLPKLVPADKKNRRKASHFLKRAEARGGTELKAALHSATSLFDGPGGDMLVVTDGQVFETEPILKAVRAMGHRVHVLGIGSASQDRFLSLLSRETGGTSRFLTARERVDLGALELFASISSPVADQLIAEPAEGQELALAPHPPRRVFAGSPVQLWGETNRHQKGQVKLLWEGRQANSMKVEYDVPDTAGPLAHTLRLLRGARLLTDLDSKLVPGTGAGERRQLNRIEERIRRLSKEYQLASRQMALVAVVKREGDRAADLPKTHVVPVGMPEDILFESYFPVLGDADSLYCSQVISAPQAIHPRPPGLLKNALLGETSTPRGLRLGRDSIQSQFADESLEKPLTEKTDPLVELAALIEPDGGMPADSLEERIHRTLLALLCFHAEEELNRTGIFKKHKDRLVQFIAGLPPGRLPHPLQEFCDASLRLIQQPGFHWKHWAQTAEELAGCDKLTVQDLERILSSALGNLPTR